MCIGHFGCIGELFGLRYPCGPPRIMTMTPLTLAWTGPYQPVFLVSSELLDLWKTSHQLLPPMKRKKHIGYKPKITAIPYNPTKCVAFQKLPFSLDTSPLLGPSFCEYHSIN